MAVNIDSIIAGAQARASSMSSTAASALNAVSSTLVSVTLPPAPALSLPGAPTLPNVPAAPTIAPITPPAPPAAPTAPTTLTVPDNISGITAPTAPGSAVPTLEAPTRPSAARSFTKSAPGVSVHASLPAAPAPFAGAAPAMTPVVIPVAPTVARPTFTKTAPTGVSAAPDATAQFRAAFSDASPLMLRTLESEMDAQLAKINPQYAGQLAAIEAKLAQSIAGGTGLSPAIENAIYERSRTKVSAETARAQAEALSQAARRGFTLPDGVLTASLQRARQNGADNNARAAVEIAVGQAELEQKNMQFAMGLSTDLRKSAMNAALSYHQNLIAINGQAVQYAQGVVDALVKTFDAEVRAFEVKLDGYRADVQVFEALMRASSMDVELYKAQIDAELAKVQVDNARVQAFRAQVDAHGAAVDTYGKNVQAIVALAELERMKLDAFRAEVDAYSAEVQGKTAEWQAYSAAWSGEESRVRAYLAQSQVYSAQVEGYRARVQAEGERIQAVATTNKASLDNYTAQVTAFGAQAQANAMLVSAQLSAQESLIKAYQAESQAIVAAASVAAEHYRTTGQIELGKAQLASTTAIEQAKLFISGAQGNAQVALSAGQVYAGMASAALAGVNALGAAVLEGS